MTFYYFITTLIQGTEPRRESTVRGRLQGLHAGLGEPRVPRNGEREIASEHGTNIMGKLDPYPVINFSLIQWFSNILWQMVLN